jgi:membrane associated rhomboid family serine protease
MGYRDWQYAPESLGGEQGRAVRWLVLATTGVLLVQWLADMQFSHQFTSLFGLSGRRLLRGAIWQPVTYLFLHGGFWHLLMNMMMLAVFGRELESAIGPKRFLRLYFGAGVLAGAGWLALSAGAHDLCIGASGAVFAVVGAFCALWPDRVLTLLLFFVLPVTMRARTLAIVLAATTTLFLMAQAGGVAHAAHLAGGIAGYVYGRRLRRAGAAWGGAWGGAARHERPGGTWRRARERLTAWVSFRRRERPAGQDAIPTMAEVDRVLDKVIAEGLSSLTRREREILERASQRREDRATPPDR